METTSRGRTRTWPRIRERACSIPFTEDKRRSVYRQEKKAAVESAITEPAGEIPERGKSSRRTMEGKAIPNRAGPSWKERNEREGGRKGSQREGGSQLSGNVSSDSSFLFAPNGFKSERVTYRSSSMRTNPSPTSSDFNRIE